MKNRQAAFSVLVYSALLLLAFLFLPVVREAQEAVASPSATAAEDVKPSFTVSTNRAYGPKDKPRIWISYQGIDHLDFRVYKVNDPRKFFEQLQNPHKIGEGEESVVTAGFKKGPSILERVRSFKSSIYVGFKHYVRSQLQRKSRVAFNDKFRTGGRQSLGEADFARVPLLNSDQLVSKWREVLTPLDNEYDSRNVPLDPQPPGVYLVEAVNGDLRAYTVALVSDITILTKTSPNGDVMAFAVNRSSGEPRSGLTLEVMKKGKVIATTVTDADGIAKTRIEQKAKSPEGDQAQQEGEGEGEAAEPAEDEPDEEDTGYVLMGWDKKSFAISEVQKYFFGWYDGEESSRDLVSYIYTDRPVYRPNQKVYFKGILRKLTEANAYKTPTDSAEITIEDPNEAKLYTKTLQLTQQGSFNGELDLGNEAPLGSYRVVAKVGEDEAIGYFEVEEYKKPEYKVTVTTPKPFVAVGETTTYAVEGKYFFGAPLNGATVEYYIYRSRYYEPWWAEEDDGIGKDDSHEDDASGYGYDNDLVKNGEGRLDSSGKLNIDFTVPQPDPKQLWDYTYRLEAQVTDSSRRTNSASASFTGIRSNIVTKAEADKYVYFTGDTAKLRVRTSDYTGKPVSSKVQLKFVRRTYNRVEKEEEGYKRVEYEPVDTDLGSGEITTNAQGEAVYDFHPQSSGNVIIKTTISEGGRQVESYGGSLWIADKSERWADFSFQAYGVIKLVADKESYRPGETAKIMAMLPTESNHLLVTTELAGVFTARHIFAPARVVMIDVPIEERYTPNVYVSVSYVKDGEMYTSDKMLAVPARDKFLTVEITPDKSEYKPRDVASYTVTAKQPDGTPAGGAEISLGVVDEAIYSISPDRAGDIRRAFYGRRYNTVNTQYATQFHCEGHSTDKPVKLVSARKPNQLADFKNESQYADAKIRKDFRDTAFWRADLVTGPDGKVTAKVPLPDNLTTWRATARAVTTDTRVGATRSKVLSRKDLLVRLEIPRFATEGDNIVVSGIVHNYLNADKVARVSLEVEGAGLQDSPVRDVPVARQGEKRVDWHLKTSDIGDARLLVKALTDTESDAVELRFPVVSGGLPEVKGSSLSLSEDNGDRTVSLEFPANAEQKSRRLRLEASPSIAGAMFGALDYLTSYPYGCTEQTMSSFLPNVIVARALKDVSSASVKASNNLQNKVTKGLDRLYLFQHQDGGWGWWKDDKTDPFMTAYVVDGLQLASGAGYPVRTYALQQGRRKITEMLDSGKTDQNKPIDLEDKAYLVYALVTSKEIDPKYLNELYSKRSQLQPYGKALTALALSTSGELVKARELAADLEKTAIQNDFDAHWESRRRPMLDFVVQNDIEATANGIRAISQLAPKSLLLPKLVRWLVSNRSRGYYWETTKDTAFAIFGLSDFLKVSKELQPDYSLEVYLNGEKVIEKRVTASDASAGQTFTLERKGQSAGNANSVRVVKKGRGALYFGSTLDYFTTEEKIAPKGNSELSLTREYFKLSVTDRGGKPTWKLEPLSGNLASGDVIVSRLKVKGSRAQYLMLEDPIPAGCEQVDQFNGVDLTLTDGKWTDWYSSREFRDRRTAIFVDYFDGDATFQYALRVITPGEFKVAPARAELMYRPSVRANSGNLNFTFSDRK